MDTLSTWASWAQIISLPIAIIAVLVSVWLYRRSKQRRCLSCEFNPIVSPIEIKAGEAIGGDIEIRYKGEPVKNLLLIRARLWNSGNLPIRKSHVVEPITFAFEPASKLLREPILLAKKPQDLKVDWESASLASGAQSNSVILGFDLLNPGDELTVDFLCTGRSTVPKITSRIEGITRIEVTDPEEKRLQDRIKNRLVMLALPLMIGLAAEMLVSWLTVILLPSPSPTEASLSGSYVFLFLAMLIVVCAIFVGKPAFDLVLYRRQKQGTE